ncbi:TnsD family Tn7-like transposition protein [Paenibacillus sp. FSL L8-0709]|uniref:TnsD family Tn7-like transposition protein n=1 Tax=Paenibacillus sp. FSL L8-0709 TaxID=2975312 RepID=UPI0030F60B5F
MIFFPVTYEDELFYSVMARYHWMSGNENPRTSMLEMFGSSNICATKLFPTHLKPLCERLPLPNIYTPSEFIENNTFLPYYANFIPIERYKKIKDIMLYGNGTSIYMLLGITASEIKKELALKYCPICIVEDEKEYGEAYWHRSHQADSISICFKHRCQLQLSNVETNQRHKHAMVTLSSYLTNDHYFQESADELLNSDFNQFIAEQSYFLLKSKVSSVGLERLRQYYIMKLKEKDLITKSERIRWIELISKFNQFYSESFLNSLNCKVIVGDEHTWFHKVLRSPRVTCHPLRHILILGFLGETMDSMFDYLSKNNITEKNNSKRLNRPSPTLGDSQLKVRIDWKQRDSEIADNIRLIAKHIFKDKNTIRVTKNEIGRRLRIQSLLVRAIDKLPESKKALDEVVESVEQFQKRRIKKAVKELTKDRAAVQPWEVVRIAGLRKTYADKLENDILNEIDINKQCFQGNI